MSQRLRHVLISLVALVAIGLGSWLLVGRRRPLPSAPLDTVPRDATAVLWVRVPALLHSTIWTRVVAAGDKGRGVRRIEAKCGFDPLEQLTQVTVFVDGDARSPLNHLGFVARGDLDHDALARCVGDVVTAEGGHVHRVEVEGEPAIASAMGDSRAVFLGSDAVAGGSAVTVRRIVRTFHGDAPGAAGAPVLSSVWARLVPGADLVAVARIPDGWRPALERWLGSGLRGGLSALARVRSIGIGAALVGGTRIGVELDLGSPSDASRLVESARALIARALDQPLVALSALGPVLRRVKVSTEGQRVTLAARASDRDIDDLLALADDTLGLRRAAALAAASRASGPDAGTKPPPDEAPVRAHHAHHPARTDVSPPELPPR